MEKIIIAFKILFIVIIWMFLYIEYKFLFSLKNDITSSKNSKFFIFSNKRKKIFDGNDYNKTETSKSKYNIGGYADIIPIITYHKILSDSEKNKKIYRKSSLAISNSTFNKQMKWLKKREYRTLTCQEFYLWHQRETELPKKSVLITFDGGTIGQANYAMPILKKYNIKGVSFIIGKYTYKNKKGIISYNKMKKLKKKYPNFDFQSHTFDLHKRIRKNVYEETIRDAAKQNKYFNFTFLAYPYGAFTSAMIKAYIKSGIKMAFTYGNNGYATRNQNKYKIRRIKINGRDSFSKFTKWFNRLNVINKRL